MGPLKKDTGKPSSDANQSLKPEGLFREMLAEQKECGQIAGYCGRCAPIGPGNSRSKVPSRVAEAICVASYRRILAPLDHCQGQTSLKLLQPDGCIASTFLIPLQRIN